MRKAAEFEHDVAVAARVTQRFSADGTMRLRRVVEELREKANRRVLIHPGLGMLERQVEE